MVVGNLPISEDSGTLSVFSHSDQLLIAKISQGKYTSQSSPRKTSPRQETKRVLRSPKVLHYSCFPEQEDIINVFSQKDHELISMAIGRSPSKRSNAEKEDSINSWEDESSRCAVLSTQGSASEHENMFKQELHDTITRQNFRIESLEAMLTANSRRVQAYYVAGSKKRSLRIYRNVKSWQARLDGQREVLRRLEAFRADMNLVLLHSIDHRVALQQILTSLYDGTVYQKESKTVDDDSLLKEIAALVRGSNK